MKKLLFILLILSLQCTTAKAEMMQISAQSAVLMENLTGKVVYEKNSQRKMPMASTTKIMTAICAIENLDMKKTVVVDERCVGIEGSSVYLEKNEEISVEELLYAMMLSSGNDAATALAIETKGSVEEFARFMTEKAVLVGAKNTNFTNACGLYEENHYTTAYDLALITRQGMKNDLFRRIVSTENATISNGNKEYPRYLKNHNKLLNMYEGCIGVKTGYTKKCGRCLVSCAQRDGVTLICVTLNAPDDWNDHMKLLDYGFSKVRQTLLASEGDYCMSVETSHGDRKLCKSVFKDKLCSLEFENSSDTQIKYFVPKKLKAPLKAGEKVGEVKVYVDKAMICQSDIVAQTDILYEKEKDFFKSFSDGFKSYLGLYTGE